jgi:hypothetical protein
MSNGFTDFGGAIPTTTAAVNTENDAVVAEAKKAINSMKEEYRNMSPDIKAEAHRLSDKVNVVAVIRKKAKSTILGLKVQNNSGEDITAKELVNGALTDTVWKAGETKVFSREDIVFTFCTNVAFLGTIGNISVKPKNELIVKIQNKEFTPTDLRDQVKFYPVPDTEKPADEYIIGEDGSINLRPEYNGKFDSVIAKRTGGSRKADGAGTISIAEAKAWLVYKMGSAVIDQYVENPAE